MIDVASEQELKKQIAELQKIVGRMKLWQECTDAYASFIFANSGDLIEPAEVPPLMKFRKRTWMPIGESHFAEVVSEDGNYQSKAYEAALKYTSKRDVAVDIGANIGLWSRPMSKDFKTVHCFEPQALARACLIRNVISNNVVVYPWALGATAGEATLTINRLATGGAMIPVTDETKAAMYEKFPTSSEKARVVPLDSLQLEPDFIKIDVQGFEAEVLRGAKRTIVSHKPTIICEAGGDVDRMSGVETGIAIEILNEYGYDVIARIGKDAILQSK